LLKACLQVNGLVRPEKSKLPQTPHPFPYSKKDISLYIDHTDNTGLVQQSDKIVVRYAHTIYPYSLALFLFILATFLTTVATMAELFFF